MPYFLYADSRPFFDKHMLVVSKQHTGAITFKVLRDYIWLLNVVFPGMRGNIATGNQMAHFQHHIYNVEFPIERRAKKWIVKGEEFRIGIVTDVFGLAAFVVESGDIEILAAKTYVMIRELENIGLFTCVVFSPHHAFIIPQKTRSIGNGYNDIFAPFKANPPIGICRRFIGPVEMAGIFLCYSRPDVDTMKKMYDALDMNTYRNILEDTGISIDDPRIVAFCEAVLAFSGDEMFLSFYDPAAQENSLTGGKGRNLSYLAELSVLSRQVHKSEEALKVPAGYILTTEAFNSIVLAKREISDIEICVKGLTDGLKKTDDEGLKKELKNNARKLTEFVEVIELPGTIQKQLKCLFRNLGGKVAVRSSATVEDSAGNSCAGQAKSVLNVETEEQLIEAIKMVWASMYEYSFIEYRNARGIEHSKSRMAVIIQRMTDAQAGSLIEDALTSTVEGPWELPVMR
jgi:hypothetical protein